MNSTFALTNDLAASATFTVADLCKAIKINDAVYHLDTTVTAQGATKYVLDGLPSTAWINPVLSDDFSYVADNAGLYVYNPTTRNYTSVLNNTFYTKKKMWSTSEAIVVYSWDTTTGVIDNYSVQAFSIPTSGTTYNLVGKMEGTYYNWMGSPTISLSQTLRTIVIYGKSNETTFFARGKTFDYTSNTDFEFTIPTWITTTQSDVSLSDQYLYAKNVVDMTGGGRKHGAYFIAHTILTEYFPYSSFNEDATGSWKRTKIMEVRNGELSLAREYISLTSFINLLKY